MPSDVFQESEAAPRVMQQRAATAPESVPSAAISRFPEIFFSAAVLLFVTIRIAGPYLGHAPGSAWSGSDWMIDYAGGFVRRGFGGWLIAHLMRWTGWSFPVVIDCITLPAWLFLCAWLLRAVARLRGPALWRFLLLLNPFLLISATESGLFDRKDTIFLCASLMTFLFAQLLPRRGTGRAPRVLLFLLYLAGLSLVLSLLHEGLFLFEWLPLTCIVAGFVLAQLGYGRRATAALLGLAFTPALLATAASVLRHGDDRAVQAICTSWQFTGTVQCSAGPGFPLWLTSLAWTIPQAISLAMSRAWTLPFCLAFFLVGAGILLLAVRVLVPHARMEHLLAAILVPLAGAFPLFVLGEDWGRWLCLITTSAVFLLISESLRPAVYNCLPRLLQNVIRDRMAPRIDTALASLRRTIQREPKLVCFLVFMFPVPPVPIWWAPVVINPFSVIVQFFAQILAHHG